MMPQEAPPTSGTGEPQGPPLPARDRRARLLRVASGAVLVVGTVLVAGFFWFVERLPAQEVMINEKADGIVVLTGGADRVADAIGLLADGRGRRLLITGVNRTTSGDEISRLLPHHRALFSCCVDLGHSALNTEGNAMEARRWAQGQGFRSLIVVTSWYHMPRAMTELGRQLPDADLIAFPVVTERLRAEPWWSSLFTARLLISEYLKYVLTQVRVRIGPPEDTAFVGQRTADRR
jgi:uncharacterized SAM-binding protein YcdF (DUF218 family)